MGNMGMGLWRGPVVKAGLLGAFLLALGGCGTLKNMERDGDVRLRDSEAIVVMGVNPRYRLHLVRGDATDETWTRPTMDIPEANLFPEDGYVVVKLKVPSRGERWGVSMVMPGGIGGSPYVPCNDSLVPTFTLRGGMVNYVGDVDYRYENNKRLTFQLSRDEEAARRFVATNYPRLDSWNVSEMTLLKARTSVCDPKTITVPIYLYVPSRR